MRTTTSSKCSLSMKLKTQGNILNTLLIATDSITAESISAFMDCTHGLCQLISNTPKYYTCLILLNHRVLKSVLAVLLKLI